MRLPRESVPMTQDTAGPAVVGESLDLQVATDTFTLRLCKHINPPQHLRRHPTLLSSRASKAETEALALKYKTELLKP